VRSTINLFENKADDRALNDANNKAREAAVDFLMGSDKAASQKFTNDDQVGDRWKIVESSLREALKSIPESITGETDLEFSHVTHRGGRSKNFDFDSVYRHKVSLQQNTKSVEFKFGNSIYEIIKSGTRFSLNDTIQIGLQMIDILKSIHEKGLLHRDIKPDNFLFDISSNNIILIDFGLCKKFIKDDGSHIEMKSTFNIIGSINYCSVNSHHLFELSRRDDLESLGNALIYINMGILPWSKLNTKEIIKECKINCIPKFFIPYFDYVRKLEFNEKPDYDLLKTILSNVKYKI
jgi:serine/threonine protein kinase